MRFEKTVLYNILFWSGIGVISFFYIKRLGLSNIPLLIYSLVVVVAIFLHTLASKNKPKYIQSCFAIKTEASHSYQVYELDWLRVLAVFFVITTHAIQTDLSKGLISGNGKTLFYTLIYMLCLSCNLIYVMLSGALLLPWKEEKIGVFYFRRVTKVVIPLIVYFIWYLWQNNLLFDMSIGSIIDRLVTANTPEAPHLWLIYVILFLYLGFPFLRYMVKEMPYKVLTIMVIVIMIFFSVVTFVPNEFEWKAYGCVWIGAAVIGYWMIQEETKRLYSLLIILGVVGSITLFLLILLKEDYWNLATNCSPIMSLITIGIFAFVLKNKRIFGKDNYLIRLLSKYSYSVILVHWWTLHWCTFGKYNLHTGDFWGFGIVLVLLVTLLISLFVAFLIDNMLIFPFLRLLDGFYWCLKHWILKKSRNEDVEKNLDGV